MPTIPHIIKKELENQPFLQQAIYERLISYGNLAEKLHPKIEKELNKKVKLSAIIMALRRYGEELKLVQESKLKFDYKKTEIILKTNIMDITVMKSNSLLANIKKLYDIIDVDKGDVISAIIGNNEVSIIFSNKYKDEILKFLSHENIINKETNLVSISMIFYGDFLHTPGVIFNVVRKLAWENINIYEIISTKSELTFILHKDHSMKAYEALEEMVK